MTPLRKAAAQTMPQSITDVEHAIARIGALTETIAGNTAALDTHILTLRERGEEQARPLRDEIDRLTRGIQAFCETRRGDLTSGGRTKSLKFLTGTVSWRKGRARVELTEDEAVIIARLKQSGLARLVRLREEIDKAEILKRPACVAGIDGIRIADAAEAFSVEPATTPKR